MSGGFMSVIDGEVHEFDSAEKREQFDELHPTCVFVKDEWNYCPKCGTQVMR